MSPTAHAHSVADDVLATCIRRARKVSAQTSLAPVHESSSKSTLISSKRAYAATCTTKADVKTSTESMAMTDAMGVQPWA